MKQLFSILLVIVLISCDSNDLEQKVMDVPALPSAMKGYELYSWQSNGNWNFTLITGTNRVKTYDEIVDSAEMVGSFVKISVDNIRELKTLLMRVPAGSSISWISSPMCVSGFSLPPELVIKEIERHCADLDLRLSIVE